MPTRRHALSLLAAPAFAQSPSPALAVSPNGRHLVRGGRPFFYLADTAWELFRRLKREEIEHYLTARRRQGFTAFQAVILSEFGGADTPNVYGDLAIEARDPLRPVEAYFRHIDWVLALAAKLDLVAALVPAWGNKVYPRPNNNDVVFTAPVARRYGEYLGRRYREAHNLLWILGGDRAADGVEGIWTAMAEGLAAGGQRAHLRTFHPNGRHSSHYWFPNTP